MISSTNALCLPVRSESFFYDLEIRIFIFVFCVSHRNILLVFISLDNPFHYERRMLELCRDRYIILVWIN